MSEETLKNCPFCGYKPLMMSADLSAPYFVYCKFCLVEQNDRYTKKEHAIEAWNTRA